MLVKCIQIIFKNLINLTEVNNEKNIESGLFKEVFIR